LIEDIPDVAGITRRLKLEYDQARAALARA
jgi:hypothetical protein